MGRKQREETHRGPGKEQNVPAMLTIPGATSTGPSRTPLALNSFASRTCTVRTGIQAHVQQNLGLHRHSTWDKAQPNPWAQEIARSLNRFRQHLQTAGNVHRGLRRSSCTVLVQWPLRGGHCCGPHGLRSGASCSSCAPQEPDGPSCRVPHSRVPWALADPLASALSWKWGAETPWVPLSCPHSQASRSFSPGEVSLRSKHSPCHPFTQHIFLERLIWPDPFLCARDVPASKQGPALRTPAF